MVARAVVVLWVPLDADGPGFGVLDTLDDAVLGQGRKPQRRRNLVYRLVVT